MPNDLVNRWTKDPVFFEIYNEVILKLGQPRGKSLREWYKSGDAPMINPYISDAVPKNLDCRYISLDNLFFEKHELGHILDNGSLTECLFIEIAFQNATAKNTNFRGSRFVRSHMTPFFAKEANFQNCSFIKCHFTGIYAGITRDSQYDKFHGTPTDLTNCNFSRSVGSSTDFDRCNFRGSDFTEVYFEDCRFDESDLRDVKLDGTRFVKCDFTNSWLCDTPENRQLVAQGDNKNIEQIQWKPVAPNAPATQPA